VVVTDPPFFDNVHYSQLADFFHVWQRPILGSVGTRELNTTRAEGEVQHSEENPPFIETFSRDDAALRAQMRAKLPFAQAVGARVEQWRPGFPPGPLIVMPNRASTTPSPATMIGTSSVGATFGLNSKLRRGPLW
jgi:hypothetical protein